MLSPTSHTGPSAKMCHIQCLLQYHSAVESVHHLPLFLICSRDHPDRYRWTASCGMSSACFFPWPILCQEEVFWQIASLWLGVHVPPQKSSQHWEAFWLSSASRLEWDIGFCWIHWWPMSIISWLPFGQFWMKQNIEWLTFWHSLACDACKNLHLHSLCCVEIV